MGTLEGNPSTLTHCILTFVLLLNDISQKPSVQDLVYQEIQLEINHKVGLGFLFLICLFVCLFFIILAFVVTCCLFWDRASCSPGWPWTQGETNLWSSCLHLLRAGFLGHVPPNYIYRVQGIKPRALCLIGKHSVYWAPPSVLISITKLT